jgi:hypothetical protein
VLRVNGIRHGRAIIRLANVIMNKKMTGLTAKDVMIQEVLEVRAEKPVRTARN